MEARRTALLGHGVVNLIWLGALGRLGLADVLLATDAAGHALALLGGRVILLVLVWAGWFLQHIKR